MDSEKLDRLLQKYWDCETSLDEERELREFFDGSEIPAGHGDAAALFRYFNENKKKSITEADFDRKIEARVTARGKGRSISWFYNSMRIAAGLVVLALATWFIRTEVRKSTPQEVIDTYDDPQLAFEETKKALMMISKGFGTAEEQTRKINLFNEAQEEIQRSSDERLTH